MPGPPTTASADGASGRDRARAFAEVVPPLTATEAIAEANRCLYCFDAPCVRACPTRIDIPAFIKKIETRNLRGSARVILDANPMGATCARVCPVDELCEGACVLGAEVRPIQIGRLQRHTTDWLIDGGLTVFRRGESIGKRVAIVGSGPAGLTVAVRLAAAGIDSTVFEAREQAGGLDTYGIVSFRLPIPVSLAEVGLVERLGVEIRTGVRVGEDVAFEELRSEFDAVVVGVGLGNTLPLPVPGGGMPGVREGLGFVEQTKTAPLDSIEVGRHVVVVGAGNTAIDCATAARRLGAETVDIIYRRTVGEMPAYRFEYEFAKRDGVQFRWLTAPKRVLGDERVEGVECVRTELGEPGTDGRRRPFEVAGSEHVIEADMVIAAIGQARRRELLTGCRLDLDEVGRVRVDEDGMTGVAGVFAAGDCVRGDVDATVVEVVADATRAAQGIIRFLTG